VVLGLCPEHTAPTSTVAESRSYMMQGGVVGGLDCGITDQSMADVATSSDSDVTTAWCSRPTVIDAAACQTLSGQGPGKPVTN
jgi:hypothetical protein